MIHLRWWASCKPRAPRGLDASDGISSFLGIYSRSFSLKYCRRFKLISMHFPFFQVATFCNQINDQVAKWKTRTHSATCQCWFYPCWMRLRLRLLIPYGYACLQPTKINGPRVCILKSFRLQSGEICPRHVNNTCTSISHNADSNYCRSNRQCSFCTHYRSLKNTG